MTPRHRTMLIGAATALVLFAVMGLIVSTTDPWQDQDAAEPASDANDLTNVTDSLFGPDVVAFEVLGILLTAAMIGALVIARPLEAQDDETRYSHPTDEQKAATDAVSNVEQADMRTEAQR